MVGLDWKVDYAVRVLAGLAALGEAADYNGVRALVGLVGLGEVDHAEAYILEGLVALDGDVG